LKEIKAHLSVLRIEESEIVWNQYMSELKHANDEIERIHRDLHEMYNNREFILQKINRKQTYYKEIRKILESRLKQINSDVRMNTINRRLKRHSKDETQVAETMIQTLSVASQPHELVVANNSLYISDVSEEISNLNRAEGLDDNSDLFANVYEDDYLLNTSDFQEGGIPDRHAVSPEEFGSEIQTAEILEDENKFLDNMFSDMNMNYDEFIENYNGLINDTTYGMNNGITEDTRYLETNDERF
jgi:predicted transcriptional regulator